MNLPLYPHATHYAPPALLFNGHLETIYPALLRKVAAPAYARERIATADDDFLDLDWIKNGQAQLVVISHGLEGDSHRPYVRGMASVFARHGFDVLAWNYRGCSGELNRQLRFYHSGAIDDLARVVDHARAHGYSKICLVGFSLGGNLTLKYLGETPHAPVHRAVAFSVPLHLHSSSLQIGQRANWLYEQRFLRNLKKKVRAKATTHPQLDTRPLKSINTLLEFDDVYTAPLHGFAHAIDYYERCSSLYVLKNIQTPTLIVNAWNDPFLSRQCYPSQADVGGHILFEVPARGGHVGFARFAGDGIYWSEARALAFCREAHPG
ncbi:MAG: alpha/beta fold hydrolase [Cyclobacteriaceae bacterium]|jgi:hypothetical protein|nr:alpha/beta fold hydrolase [Cyclobacteriaceae bacterium]